ncbi:LysM peptidoglycan-binding domain-containing protein [uncultured Serinicoccus sp.]|uniref:LysM peptidoglycan-binding domain-containing protein n=1 Tax=uncultured Serinicoccus sp. TaxID=735514 RepID=UPI002615D364|nr:LysM domain-containing protein [uncultured Serinicoccus sp.]
MDTTRRRVGGPPVGWRASAWGGVAATTALVAAGVLGRQAVTTWSTRGTPDPGAAVLGAMLTLATALLLWVAAVLLVAAWRVRPAAGSARPLPPTSPSVRVATALLVLLATGAGGPGAAAAPVCATAPNGADDRADDHRAETGEAAPGGPMPSPPDPGDVPLPGWTPGPVPAEAPARGQVDLVGGRAAGQWDLPEHVVVRRGDTLWDLAARHLGAQATSADIAQEWPRWYAANLATIGPDPDLILPGQELTVPGTAEDGR